MNQKIEPYPKTSGFLFSFEVVLGSEAWNDCVVEVIELGQRVGHEWILSGDVRDDLSGWSNKPSIPGVKAIEWILISESAPTTDEAIGPRGNSILIDAADRLT